MSCRLSLSLDPRRYGTLSALQHIPRPSCVPLLVLWRMLLTQYRPRTQPPYTLPQGPPSSIPQQLHIHLFTQALPTKEKGSGRGRRRPMESCLMIWMGQPWGLIGSGIESRVGSGRWRLTPTMSPMGRNIFLGAQRGNTIKRGCM